MKNNKTALIAIATLCAWTSAAYSQQAHAPDFARDVQPIFKKNCYEGAFGAGWGKWGEDDPAPLE